MQRSFARVGLAAVILALVASTHLRADDALPMKGRGEFEGQAFPDGSVIASGTGWLTHLGKCRIDVRAQVVRVYNNGNSVDLVAELVFTAANGDQLTASAVSTLDRPTRIQVGVLNWTGGTGRFAHASGEAEFVTHDSGLDAQGRFSGSIAIDGYIELGDDD